MPFPFYFSLVVTVPLIAMLNDDTRSQLIRSHNDTFEEEPLHLIMQNFKEVYLFIQSVIGTKDCNG